MSETCKWPIKCNSPAGKGGYCFMHNKLVGGEKTTGPKDPKPIPKESKKRKEIENPAYRKAKKEIFKDSDRCELRIPGVCTGKAQGADHVQKRSPNNFSDVKNLKRSCNACNTWKEAHPKEAAALGLSKSKYKK